MDNRAQGRPNECSMGRTGVRWEYPLGYWQRRRGRKRARADEGRADSPGVLSALRGSRAFRIGGKFMGSKKPPFGGSRWILGRSAHLPRKKAVSVRTGNNPKGVRGALLQASKVLAVRVARSAHLTPKGNARTAVAARRLVSLSHTFPFRRRPSPALSS